MIAARGDNDAACCSKPKCSSLLAFLIGLGLGRLIFGRRKRSGFL